MSLLNREAVEKLSTALDEPNWMREARLAAWAHFEKTPVPVTTDEAWRRTSLRRLKMNDIAPSIPNGKGITLPAGWDDSLKEVEESGSLLQVDGTTGKVSLDPALAAQGVIFGNLNDVVRQHGDVVKPFFMTEAVAAEAGKFAAMNGAFWRGGTFLYVPANVQVKAPLYSANWLTGAQTFSHTLVVLERGAEATLIEEFKSDKRKGQAVHNGVVELILRDGANLHYASLQDFEMNVWQLNHERARVSRDAQLDWVTSTMGTRLTKNFQTVDLDGRGAFARVSGMFFGHGRQHFDLDTQQNHNAPDTNSDLLYKGALRDKARSVWQGMIKTLPGAQRIDGFQANRNLLLQRTARADSIPGLEIEADDVRCTHASTVGHLDQEVIFYLMSRGIHKDMATRMVVEGFFAPVLVRVPLDSVRERITERILEKVGSDL